jgi:DNA-binding NtrC family response regulator
LNVITLDVPPLKDRKDDVPLLVDHFLGKYALKNNRPLPRIGRRLMEKLVAYEWPGNVRQLEHLIERAVILCRGGEIEDLRLPDETETPTEMPGGGAPVLPPMGTALQEWLLNLEREVLVAALKEAGGVQARAARRLGISRSNLNYRIGRLGIEVKDVDYG